MPGCKSRPAALASTRKRCLYFASASGSKPESDTVLMATVRSIFGSRVRYTTPITPRPSSFWISYRPRFVPTWVAMISSPNRAAYAGEYATLALDPINRIVPIAIARMNGQHYCILRDIWPSSFSQNFLTMLGIPSLILLFAKTHANNILKTEPFPGTTQWPISV